MTTEPDLSGVTVLIEDDATPLVRMVARAMRTTARRVAPPSALTSSSGQRAVVIAAKGGPQTATCVLTEGRIEITHGVTAEADATAVVDVYDLTVDVDASTGDKQLLDFVATLMSFAPPTDWQTAAREFWSRTSVSQGMPKELVFECRSTHERLVLGTGLPTYRIVADGDDLSRLCSGTVGLLEALGAGVVAIQGSLPQLSVMSGAFNKMRFDV